MKLQARFYATAKRLARFLKPISPPPFKKNNPDKPKKLRHHEFGDTLRHKFGEFNGLTTVDKLGVSIDDTRSEFLHYKINKDVREFFMEEIKQKSLLYQQAQMAGEAIREDPKPTKIQKMALSLILKPRSAKNPEQLRIYSVAGETGCGKTYAYLMPIVSNLKDDLERPLPTKKIVSYSENYTRTEIRLVIFVPTNELVEQVSGVLKNLDTLGLTTAELSHESNTDDLVALNKPVDILVTTPQRFNSMKRYTNTSMYRKLMGLIKYVVLDEADTLLDRSFLEETMSVFKAMLSSSPRLKDVVIVSLTVLKVFNSNLATVFKNNDIIRVYLKSIHRLSRKLSLRVIDCTMKPFRGSKVNALKQCLYSMYCDNTESYADVKKVLVFVNEKENVGEIYNMLKTKDDSFKDYELYKITGDNTLEERLEVIKAFNLPKRVAKKDPELETKYSERLDIPNSNISLAPIQKKESEKPVLRVLITTDLLSRGINFEQTYNLVLFDIPKTTADLVNRVGRVGRIGMSGRVFILAGKGETKGWVTGLPKSVRNGVPLA